MGSKYIIPCDPVLYLNNDYPNWERPLVKGTHWLNLDLNSKRKWPHGSPIYYFPHFKFFTLNNLRVSSIWNHSHFFILIIILIFIISLFTFFRYF